MKYILMFCDGPHDDLDDFHNGLVEEYLALQQEAERNGSFVTGATLQGADSGARVRIADGETVATDGPVDGLVDTKSPDHQVVVARCQTVRRDLEDEGA